MSLETFKKKIGLKLRKQAKTIAFNFKERELLKSNDLLFCRFRAEDFPKQKTQAWLDRDNAIESIQKKLSSGTISNEDARQLEQFSTEGLAICKQMIDPALIDEMVETLDGAIKRGDIHGLEWKNEQLRKSRVMDFQERIPALNKLFKNPAIIRFLNLVFERPVIPFQSLNFFYSSEQEPHSDAIHMSSYPLGFMSAAWIALEDIHPDSGPLEYYPGSHKLPYVFSKDVGISDTEYVLGGREVYSKKYEPYIENLIKEHKLQAKQYLPKKGDVLFWHHNLIHGGTPVVDESKTRRAFVCHYFAKDVICYHDLIAEKAKVREEAISVL